MRIKKFSDLLYLSTFEDRFEYLKLKGDVGKETFGFDRYLNQEFYHSYEWKQARRLVIIRDNSCDLGIEGYEIHNKLIVHHMNPITSADIVHGNSEMFNPEFLICVTEKTHNAIHYGDINLLDKKFVPRSAKDTKLW